MIYYLTYFSKATRLMQEEELTYLLQQSRSWNQDHGLTGMLVYLQGRFIDEVEGRFMQVLEGTQQEVEGIFKNIEKDIRHHQVLVLKRDFIDKRHFETWQMGFESVSLEARNDVKGFFHVDENFLKHDIFNNSNIALTFLKSFYDTHITFNF